MNLSLKILIITFSLALANFAGAVSNIASASATVLVPINASINSGLNFGTFQVSDSGGTIQVDQGVACSVVTTGSVMSSIGSTCASLNVNAAFGQAVSLSLDVPSFTLADASGHTVTGTLALSSSTCYVSGGSPLCSEIKIGGTLTVGGISSNPSGSYSTSNGGGSAGSVHLEYN
jgi:hypothetical protein